MADETHRLRQILGADDDDRDERDQQQFGGRDIEHSASLASPRADRRAGGRFSDPRAASRRHGRRRDRRPFWSRYDHGHGLSAYRHPLRRSEEPTSELQSLMRNSYDVFCLKKKKSDNNESTQRP